MLFQRKANTESFILSKLKIGLCMHEIFSLFFKTALLCTLYVGLFEDDLLCNMVKGHQKNFRFHVAFITATLRLCRQHLLLRGQNFHPSSSSALVRGSSPCGVFGCLRSNSGTYHMRCMSPRRQHFGLKTFPVSTSWVFVLYWLRTSRLKLHLPGASRYRL